MFALIAAIDVNVMPGFLLPFLIVGGLVWLSRSRVRTRLFYRHCPHCKERMRGDATVCPHCQRESESWRLHEGRWWRKDDAGNW